MSCPLLRSFFIQNFADSFRQCIIDLMQGQLQRADELREDDVLETIVQILTPESRPPLRGYYSAGVLGPELKLLESIVLNRCASRTIVNEGLKAAQSDGNEIQLNVFTQLQFLVAPIVTILLFLSL